MHNKVTVQDIADALGISRNTVSKAINNSGGLADATREKILQKAVEMGYKQFSYVRAAASSLPADQLYMDNSTEISRFIRDALQRGEQHIGFIGNPNHCQSFYERYLAFFFTMQLAGGAVEEKYCIRHNHTDEIIEQHYALDELPDLFICANDFVAGDAIRALYSLGKTVPEDVRILGFDDSTESRRSRPTLSTVHIHTHIMADEAVHLLMSRMKEPTLNYRVVHTQTDLIERESTKH